MNKLFPIVLALLFFSCAEEENELTKVLDDYESFCSRNSGKDIESMSDAQLADFKKMIEDESSSFQDKIKKVEHLDISNAAMKTNEINLCIALINRHISSEKLNRTYERAYE